MKYLTYLLVWLLWLPTKAQVMDSSLLGSTDRLVAPRGRLQVSAVRLEKRITRQTDKYLTKLHRQERKLIRLIASKDSLKARILFFEGQHQQSLQSLQKELEQPHSRLDSVVVSYSSRLDSLQTALQFLEQTGLSARSEKLEAALNQYNQLQGKLNQTERIKQYVQQRQKLLQTQLSSLGLTKRLRGFQKQAYYYQVQVSEYKQVLAYPTRLEKQLLQEVRKLPAFQPFFRKQSQLATLFRLPTNQPLLDAGNSIPGLQTVAGLQAAFTQKFGEEVTIAETFQQKLQAAETELSQQKNKTAAAGSATDVPLPDFKPNHQKTKTFWQRLEIGTNLQSTKSNTYFPVTTDVGVSLGYKLHDKVIIGLGSSYKLGWGTDIRHLDITQQGAGLRSFLDYQLKRSFWLSGGAELHHRSQESDALNALPHYTPWQKMALLGLTKKYSINAQYQGKVQLLYDFLHQQQAPTSQAILFRVGYTF